MLIHTFGGNVQNSKIGRSSKLIYEKGTMLSALIFKVAIEEHRQFLGFEWETNGSTRPILHYLRTIFAIFQLRWKQFSRYLVMY